MRIKELQNDIIQWDVNNWKNVLTLWDEHIKEKPQMRCLEIGARKGGLSLYAAVNGHRSLCTDIVDHRESAGVLHKKHHVDHLVDYAVVNGFEMNFQNEFDIVFVKSVFPIISRAREFEGNKMIINIHRALKPGGKLLFAENLKATMMHQFLRKSFVSWSAGLLYRTPEELQKLLSPFPNITYKRFGLLGTLGRTEGQRQLLGTIDNSLAFMIPESWKYVIGGVAVKQ